jgi:16S rRNA (cytosine1402-N4)-methyltransferase
VAEFAHESVLVDEVLSYLSVRDHETYVDATVGGGGHAEAILRAAGARVIAIDRDAEALAAAADRLAPFGDRARFVRGAFGDLRALVTEPVAGIVVDLGVSSPQLDRAERGFSFTRAGPIDMRMDASSGPTALDLVRSLDETALATAIAEYGEERHAKRVSRAIKAALRDGALHTTIDLAAAITRAIPIVEQRKSKIHPATRTFQALRIATNGELEQLERLLDAFPDLLAPGGRFVAISFHSLEDRLTKNRLRDLAWTSSLPPRLAAEAGERSAAVCEILAKKPVEASDAEVARNPRARSAKLRACARTSAPNVPAHSGAADGARQMRMTGSRRNRR